jgi:hypothetical protein
VIASAKNNVNVVTATASIATGGRASKVYSETPTAG